MENISEKKAEEGGSFPNVNSKFHNLDTLFLLLCIAKKFYSTVFY